jgi:4-diphosphocytidyl-2-C-methyl-D-erythritol kinase
VNREADRVFDRFPAPGKLNLFLHVVGRRPDGYHLLQSVFRLIDYGDELGIHVRDDGRIRILHAIEGVPEEYDLCLRAARLLKDRTRSPLGAEIELVKCLPIGGGLGGGSSDAATVLIALNRLWKTGLSRSQLQGLGAELGADVPFFVFGESAFVEGIGEKLTPVALGPTWYLVLVPHVSVATKDVFAAPELKRDSPAILPAHYVSGFGVNDLQAVTCARHPEIARHLEWLSGYAKASMTGSGACVFAAFDSEARAQEVFAQRPADMRGFVAAGLNRHPLFDLVDVPA